MSKDPIPSGLIERIANLPSLPVVLQKISAIMADPESSAGDVVNAVKLDPAVVGKVLRLANSAYVGIPRTVSSLQNAVVLLGLRRIHSLVLGSSVLGSVKIPAGPAFRIEDFWRHSITVALVAEEIARYIVKYHAIESEEVFSAGLLHDIGRLILCGYDPEAVAKQVEQSQNESVPLFQAESAGCSHGAIGGHLARHWNFPEELEQAIGFHHTPAEATVGTRLVAVIHVADIMTHMIGFQTFPGEAIPSLDEYAVAALGMEPEMLRAISNQALENEKKLESLVHFFS